MIQGHYGTTDSLFLLSSYSFCMTFCELPNMSDPNAEFLQQYKQVCLKSHFQLGVKCNLTFFFWFCFSLHCNCSWKVVPISQPIQCKNVFFFKHFFFWWMVKAENFRFRNYLQWPIFYHQLRMIKPNYLFILTFPSAQMQNHSFCRNSSPLFSFSTLVL